MGNIYNFCPVDLHAGNKNAEKPIIAIYRDGEFCKFPSARAAGRMMNVASTSIVACLKGRIKTAGGCRWVYADQFCWKDVCGGQAPQGRMYEVP